MKFSFQIYDRQGATIETGEIEAVDHWGAVRKLDHFKPDGSFPGGLHWCTLSNITDKMQHHVFPDGSVTDRPINVRWNKD